MIAALLLGSNSAEAKVKIPFFDSMKRGGSSTEASQSAYEMTGESSCFVSLDCMFQTMSPKLQLILTKGLGWAWRVGA